MGRGARNGSIELLLTQPITLWQAVLGKFLAAWIFVGIALALTFPIWITVNYLGDPDNGAIFAAYIGSCSSWPAASSRSARASPASRATS